MKVIVIIVCFLGTIFLRTSHEAKYFRSESQNRQHLLDSLKIVLHDIQKDTVVCKMLTDVGYRTKMMTLINVLPDQEIVKLVNKYKPQTKRAKGHKKMQIARKAGNPQVLS